MMQERDRNSAIASASSETLRQIVARSAIQPHPFAVLACDNPEAIKLDFRAARARRKAAFCLCSPKETLCEPWRLGRKPLK
jgi:hypothetical protein